MNAITTPDENIKSLNYMVKLWKIDNLRNTKAEEITLKEQAVRAPTADVAAGEVEKGTVVTFASATEDAVIYLSLDGETWAESR